MLTPIPLSDMGREYAEMRSDIDRALARVLQRRWFILGEEGQTFEAEWAAYCGIAYAAGVGNGTDAIQLALRAAGVGAGDEMIVPALTATFTALAVSMTGAKSVFADINSDRYTLDPASLEAAITHRTAAVIPVHLYGCPADMAPILEAARRHSLLVLEDAAQAHGARYRGRRVGGSADAATFSFYPSKNLGAYGDGGAIVTDDAGLAEKARMLRHGGQRQTWQHELLGCNSRLDELRAAILRAELPYLDGRNERRRTLAARYDAGLRDCNDLSLPTIPSSVEHVYHLYVVRTSARDALRDHLASAKVATGIHYPKAVHLQPAYDTLSYRPGSCPRAEAATAEVLSLPMFLQMTTSEVDHVIGLIRAFFGTRGHEVLAATGGS